MSGFSESTETDLGFGASSVFIAPCVHALWALESHQFQRLEAGPRFYSSDGSSNSDLDTAVWTVDHLKYTYVG